MHYIKIFQLIKRKTIQLRTKVIGGRRVKKEITPKRIQIHCNSSYVYFLKLYEKEIKQLFL